jgi:rhamnosyltransferase
VEVSVLLSTFNSESFLAELLDSVLSQDYVDFKLHIRDDGSTDRTVSILESYFLRDSRVILHRDLKGNISCAHSFLELLTNVEADLYFFCDHDDVWLHHKISRFLTEVSLERDTCIERPLIVHSDLIVVSENLEIISDSFFRLCRFDTYESSCFEDLAVCNRVTGCAMLINRQLRDLVLAEEQSDIFVHDHWIALIGASYDAKFTFIPESTVLYRQHLQNVIGVRHIHTPWHRKVFKSFVDFYRQYRQARSIVSTVSMFDLFKAKLQRSWKCSRFLQLIGK